MKLHSPDLGQENIAKIRELFPGCVTEAEDEKGELRLVVDFDQLRQELCGHIVEGGQERYRLDWPGKREALALANAPTTKTLRPCREESVDFDTTRNLFIEGDNLEALKLLQESYLGKVKMIYIDPPYNTGNDFIYRDDYHERSEVYFKKSNQLSEAGDRLVANTESNGRFHSDWLSMMYPRLRLAKNLLRDDGVIFVSIDDNEQANLRALCDQVFGGENYLVTMYIQVRYPGKTLVEKNDYQKLIEQILVYQKRCFSPIKESKEYSLDKFCWEIKELGSGKKETIDGKNVEIFYPGSYKIVKAPASLNGLKATWATGAVLKTSGRFFGKNLAPRKDTDGLGVLYKVYGVGEDGLGYRYFTGPQRETATKGKLYSGVPLARREEIASGVASKENPILNYYNFAGSFGNCRHEGSMDFRSGKKPIEFLKTFIKQATAHDENGIVLDFFAGSSSSAHAVLDANKEDGGNRSYIMVQLSESVSEEEAQGGFSSIADISKERIRRAGSKILAGECSQGWSQDVGFRVLKVDTSNMEEVYYRPDEVRQVDLFAAVDNVKPDRSAEDLLFQVLVDGGVDLALPIRRETVQGKVVFFVDDDALVACFDGAGITEELVRELAGYRPRRVVFRDNGFASDAVKINVGQIFRQLSPATDVRTI